MTGLAHAKKRQSWLHGLAISLKRDWRLYLMMILPVIFYIMFRYTPMHGIVIAFQNYNLFPHYTVMKNITDAPIRVLKRPREQAEARAHELIAQMGLVGNENKVPCELSGGQQQRVSIARALALDPEILFFDEPTSALDPELTAEVLRVIKDLAAQNMTMVIVTHAMQFARDVADRVVFMDGGRIVEEGPAEQVIDHPREQRTREFLSRIEG